MKWSTWRLKRRWKIDSGCSCLPWTQQNIRQHKTKLYCTVFLLRLFGSGVSTSNQHISDLEQLNVGSRHQTGPMPRPDAIFWTSPHHQISRPAEPTSSLRTKSRLDVKSKMRPTSITNLIGYDWHGKAQLSHRTPTGAILVRWSVRISAQNGKEERKKKTGKSKQYNRPSGTPFSPDARRSQRKTSHPGLPRGFRRKSRVTLLDRTERHGTTMRWLMLYFCKGHGASIGRGYGSRAGKCVRVRVILSHRITMGRAGDRLSCSALWCRLQYWQHVQLQPSTPSSMEHLFRGQVNKHGISFVCDSAMDASSRRQIATVSRTVSAQGAEPSP